MSPHRHARHPLVALGFLLGAPFFAGCGSDAPLGRLTDRVTIVPITARSNPADPRNPTRPDAQLSLLDDGFGDYELGPGEPHQLLVVGGATRPADGPSPRRLARFAHMPDLQLADDESVTRVLLIDAPGIASSASRPQDTYGCHMVNAMVRTLNGVHRRDALDFVLLGGDNIDNAQTNELEWALQLLGEGGTIECDSGVDNDPIPGPRNDPKDPFESVGLDVPFYWVMGNHDVLIQGNFQVTAGQKAASVGTLASGRTRDWSQPGGPAGSVVPADPEREALTPSELIERVVSHDNGHGLTATQAASGRAFYTFDVPSTPLRFVIIDTTATLGGAEGLLREADRDLLVAALDQAVVDGKWVMLASHHAARSLTTTGGTFGTVDDPLAITTAEFTDLVTSYDNVLFSFVGHSHQHRIAELAGNGRAVVEVMTAAVADFPHQSRIVEIWDMDNGWVMLRGTAVDFSTQGDALAEEARRLGIVDYTAGWADENPSMVTDRNVEIFLPAPSVL
ncbi:MAG: metallophosphoesterase [Myxococcales bacterium]|nr:metallophosphoesterase [Myxococcales bacterium]MCB9627765.1 metallophosphoesterase [Sandaracinaceae bacterium]